MEQNKRACLAGAAIGAALGAAVAYLYATDDGARSRLRMTRAVDRLMLDADEAQRLWSRLNEAWSRFEVARAHSAPRVERQPTWPGDAA